MNNQLGKSISIVLIIAALVLFGLVAYNYLQSGVLSSTNLVIGIIILMISFFALRGAK